MDDRTREAIDLMDRFAERTGLTSSRPSRRYLWTDAFAVMTDIGLHEVTGEHRFLERALDLVDAVHHTLGRHRDDDRREGWLSGLDEAEGERHPTRGGLRIGKRRPERRRGEALDPTTEWDSDGQYFHYLTRWMQALDRAARATADGRYALWARELCETAAAAFVHRGGPHARPSIVWKMSIDLSRALVPTTGQHDALDGYVTARQLETTRRELGPDAEPPVLVEIATELYDLIDARDLPTTDPLGIGGLLLDAAILDQIDPGAPLCADLLASARAGLRIGVRHLGLAGPAATRLAFREFGLAIGLAAAVDRFGAVHDGAPLREDIENFWREPRAQRSPTWLEHEDINAVMLAASLAPRGVIDRPARFAPH